MNELEQKILDHAISHWQKDFTGINGINVAEVLDLEHKTVLGIFDELEKQGKGNVRRDVKLYQISISLLDNQPNVGEPQEVNTHIFFPSKDVLTEDYYKQGFHRKSTPEYKSRLLKGYSQIHLLYFENEVLKKYLDRREIYDIESTVTGGHIRLTNEYMYSLSDDEFDKVAFPTIRFGKRHLARGDIAITVILHDLSELPEKDQAYWYSHEIEEPQFLPKDPDFEIFFRRNFEAEFLNDNDPLSELLNEINEINAIVGDSGLFAIVSNPYVSYPVVNTYKSFCDSCSELYKVVGSDSINEKKVKNILKNRFGFSEQDFVHKKSKRPLGKLDLFKRFCGKIGCEHLFDTIEEIKSYRISADHKVVSPKLTEQNFIAEYRQICHKLKDDLILLRQEIEKIGLHPK
jgi:hypothetical protein